MQHLNAQQLEGLQRAGEDFMLVNVLPRKDYVKAHIPASSNIPLEGGNFEKDVEKRLGNKNKKIVVYCAGKDCPAAGKAADRLEKAGFRNVYEFDGGMKEWKDTGHKVEGNPETPTFTSATSADKKTIERERGIPTGMNQQKGGGTRGPIR